jgi:hypothetical protein
MKLKIAVLAVTASLVACFYLNQNPSARVTAAPQAPCGRTPLGWWESKDLLPLFSSANGPAPQTDCDFHVWSWTAFAHWMQKDKNNNGQPLFLRLPTDDDLKSGDRTRFKVGPRTLSLKPRNLKPKTMDRIEQAGSNGVLVDQHGRAVYYSIHMDLIYFGFTQNYFGPDKYKNAAPSLTYPIGATVFKASWRIVQPGEQVTDAFTTTATIDLLQSDGKGGLRVSGQTQPNVTVALVGVHVVGVIKDHPEFAWATFEQIGNAPDLPDGLDPTSSNPVSSQFFTFYHGGAPANVSNQQSKMFTIDPASQVISPITNVFRQFAYGGAQFSPPGLSSRVADIMSVNQVFQTKIQVSKNINHVFANYRLIGTVWILANTLKPGDGNLDSEAIGSIDLANSTMETFAQGAGSSCFTCHTTSAGGTYPGKNINLSHALLDSLPRNIKRLTANP